MRVLLMYMPVVHAGYIALIKKIKPEVILIVSDEIANRFDKRRKDIRALSSKEIIEVLRGLFPEILTCEYKGDPLPDDSQVHMPVEDISDDLIENYPLGNVAWESVFLRYDSKKSKSPEEIIPDAVVSRDDPSVKAILEMLEKEAAKSPDWWRQVAAAVVKDGKVLSLRYNIHQPSNAVTYALGDPRGNAQKGVSTNVGKVAHAEPLACFHAGVEGCIGADLFATTFPCPQCANFISFTKIRRLIFVEGYAMVNGAEDLRSAGIEIVKVI